MTTIAVAPSTVAPLVRKPSKYGLLSVVTPTTDTHFLYGGVQADTDVCSQLLTTDIDCGPSADKVAASLTETVTGDPWAIYLMSSCKTIGMLGTAEATARRAFDAGESSAVEKGFHEHVLVPNGVDVAGGTAAAYEVKEAIGRLEQYAAENYGGQVILHLPAVVAAMAGGALINVGGHLETAAGNLVAVGAYPVDHGPGGVTAGFAWIWATGATALVRSEVTAVPTQIDFTNNDFYVLVERGYAAMVDCLVAAAAVEYCGCGSGGGPVTPPTPTPTLTIVTPSTGTVGVSGTHHATGTLLDTADGVIVDGPGGATLPVTNVSASGFDFTFTPTASGAHHVIATEAGAELARKNSGITVGTTAPPTITDITSVTPSAVDSGALIIYTVRGTGLGAVDTVNVSGPENVTGIAVANVLDTEFTFAATLTIEGIYAVAALDGATVVDTRPMSIAVTECATVDPVIDIFTVTPATVPEDTATTFTVTGQLLSTIDGAHLEGPK